MRYARIKQGVAVVVHRVATHNHFVPSILVRIANTDLVESRTSRGLAEKLMPVGRLAIHIVVSPCAIVIMMTTIGVTRMPLHHDGRMHTVVVENAHVSHVLIVFIAHQRCTIRSRIVRGVSLLHRSLLASRHAIHNGHISWRILHRLLFVINDSIAIRVTRRVAIHKETKRFLVGVPELSAIAGLHNQFTLPVAVYVVCTNLIVLSRATQLVGT